MCSTKWLQMRIIYGNFINKSISKDWRVPIIWVLVYQVQFIDAFLINNGFGSRMCNKFPSNLWQLIATVLVVGLSIEKTSENHFQNFFVRFWKMTIQALIVLTQQFQHILIKSDDFIKLLLQFVVAPKRKLKCPNMGSLLKKERQ